MSTPIFPAAKLVPTQGIYQKECPVTIVGETPKFWRAQRHAGPVERYRKSDGQGIGYFCNQFPQYKLVILP